MVGRGCGSDLLEERTRSATTSSHTVPIQAGCLNKALAEELRSPGRLRQAFAGP